MTAIMSVRIAPVVVVLALATACGSGGSNSGSTQPASSVSDGATQPATAPPSDTTSAPHLTPPEHAVLATAFHRWDYAGFTFAEKYAACSGLLARHPMTRNCVATAVTPLGLAALNSYRQTARVASLLASGDCRTSLLSFGQRLHHVAIAILPALRALASGTVATIRRTLGAITRAGVAADQAQAGPASACGLPAYNALGL